MIDIILRGIVSNTEKIESVVKKVNNIDKKRTTQIILLGIGLYIITKAVSKQDQRIDLIERKLEIQSKGE